MHVLGLLLLTGFALFAGPVFEFLPDVAWQGGPVANAMVWHDRQRIEQVVLLAMMAVGAATIWRGALFNTLVNLPRPVRWALGVGFALGGVSAGLSEFPRFAALEWATLLLLLGLAFLLADQARGGGQFDTWAMRLLVVVSGVIVLRIMMGYLAATVQGVRLDSVTLFTSVFSNRRVFGQVACMAIPLLAYPLVAGGGTRAWRWGVFVLLAVWWMLVIVSGTRGTWAALFVAAAVLAAFAWRACVGWLRIQVAALGVGALLFWIMFVLLPVWLGQDATLENRLSNIDSLSGRDELWAMAWAQIQAHPWLGIGPMHLAAIPMRFGAHPHNAVLQLAAEWGVPAALALLLPAVFGVQRMLARLRQQASSNLLLVCLAAGLLAAGAQSMVDGEIVMPYTQIWLALVMGWAVGVYFRDVDVSAPVVPASRMMHLVVPVLSLFALTLLLKGIFPEVFHRVEATQAFIDAGNNSIPPRYWMVGRIP
jgi:O-antigen ligase